MLALIVNCLQLLSSEVVAAWMSIIATSRALCLTVSSPPRFTGPGPHVLSRRFASVGLLIFSFYHPAHLTSYLSLSKFSIKEVLQNWPTYLEVRFSWESPANLWRPISWRLHPTRCRSNFARLTPFFFFFFYSQLLAALLAAWFFFP